MIPKANKHSVPRCEECGTPLLSAHWLITDPSGARYHLECYENGLGGDNDPLADWWDEIDHQIWLASVDP